MSVRLWLAVAVGIATLTAMPASAVAAALNDPVSTLVPDGEVKAIAISGSTAYIGGNFSRIAPYTGSVLFDASSGALEEALARGRGRGQRGGPRRGRRLVPGRRLQLGGRRAPDAVSGYDRWKGCPGPKVIRRLADEWGEANIGIITSLSGVTIADVDDAGRDADEIIKRAGDTPLITRTPSGGVHLWYRSSGERNANLRPSGLAVDVKGSAAGIVVVPPSYRRTTGLSYVFEHGSWDDLDHLPFARPGSLSLLLGEIGAGNLPVHRGQRNNRLFKIALREACHCDDLQTLVDVVATINEGLPEPLAMNEVARLATSAWGYETTGRNWIGGRARVQLETAMVERLSMAQNGPDALLLLARLQTAHGARQSRGEPFAISPKAMSADRIIGLWGPRRYREARQTLVELGFLRQIHKGGHSPHDPSLFRFVDRGSD